MNLEINIQSEVNQKEKNKYCVLTHIYGIQKNSTNEPICKEGMDTQTTEQTCGHHRGRRGEDKLRKQR